MSKSDVLRSQMELKLEGHCLARWTGAKDPETIAELYSFFQREGWKGQWVLNFPGNGGVSEIIFTEVRRASQENA